MSQHLPAASPGQFFTPAVLYYGIRCAVLWYPLCRIMVSAVLYYGIHCAVLWYLSCCIMESTVLYYGIRQAESFNHKILLIGYHNTAH